jgi:hypothetical protein
MISWTLTERSCRDLWMTGSGYLLSTKVYFMACWGSYWNSSLQDQYFILSYIQIPSEWHSNSVNNLQLKGENLFLNFKMLFSNNSNNFKPIVTCHFTKSFLFWKVCVGNEPIRRCPAEIKEFGKAESNNRRHILSVKFGRGVETIA